MSSLKKIFGLRKKAEPCSKENAITKLKETEEVLLKKSEFIEKEIEKQLLIAKSNATTNKRVALRALKKKKRYEKEQKEVDGLLTRVEMQREALEGAGSNLELLDTMKMAADALKHAYKDLDVDKVQDVIDAASEQEELAMELSDAISTTFIHAQFDEDELLKELEDIEQEQVNQQLLHVKLLDVSDQDLPASRSVDLKREVSSSKKRVTFYLGDEEGENLAALAT